MTTVDIFKFHIINLLFENIYSIIYLKEKLWFRLKKKTSYKYKKGVASFEIEQIETNAFLC